jgi:hypothetical protein
MSCRIPEPKRRTIKVDIALGNPSKEITTAVNVSGRLVQRFSTNMKVHDSLAPPKVVTHGQPRVITPEMERYMICCPCSISRRVDTKSLRDYLAARPSMYIDEQVYYLWDAVDIQVDEQCITCMLKPVKWSKKKVLHIPLFDQIFRKLSDF